MLPKPEATDRRPWMIWLALLPSLAVLLYGLDLPHLGYFKDDGVYLATASSLAAGNGHRTANLAHEPWQVKYPPLYPAYLAIAWKAGSTLRQKLILANVLNWLALPLFAFLTLRTAHYLRAPAPALLTLWCLSYAGTADAAHSLLSDLWMACAVMAALLLAERSPAGAALLTIAAYFLRSAALAVVGAVLLTYLLQRRFRDILLYVVLVVPPILIWTKWAAGHAAPLLDYNDVFMSTYANVFAYELPLAEIPARLPLHVRSVLTEIGRILLPDAMGRGLEGLRLAVGAGMVGCALTLPRLHQLYLAASLALLVMWPWRPFARFFVPMLPFLVIGVGRAIGALAARYRLSFPPAALATVVFMLLCVEYLRQGYIVRAHREMNTALAPVYDWVRSHTPGEAGFCAYREAMLFFVTGRHAESMHGSVRQTLANPAYYNDRIVSMPSWARQRGYRYVLYSPDDYRLPAAEEGRLRAALEKDGVPVFQANGFTVYDLQRTPSP